MRKCVRKFQNMLDLTRIKVYIPLIAVVNGSECILSGILDISMIFQRYSLHLFWRLRFIFMNDKKDPQFPRKRLL